MICMNFHKKIQFPSNMFPIYIHLTITFSQSRIRHTCTCVPWAGIFLTILSLPTQARLQAPPRLKTYCMYGPHTVYTHFPTPILCGTIYFLVHGILLHLSTSLCPLVLSYGIYSRGGGVVETESNGIELLKIYSSTKLHIYD